MYLVLEKADFGACGRVLVFVMDGRKLQTPKLGNLLQFELLKINNFIFEICDSDFNIICNAMLFR